MTFYETIKYVTQGFSPAGLESPLGRKLGRSLGPRQSSGNRLFYGGMQLIQPYLYATTGLNNPTLKKAA